jgi:hypothetical protein
MPFIMADDIFMEQTGCTLFGSVHWARRQLGVINQ